MLLRFIPQKFLDACFPGSGLTAEKIYNVPFFPLLPALFSAILWYQNRLQLVEWWDVVIVATGVTIASELIVGFGYGFLYLDLDRLGDK